MGRSAAVQGAVDAAETEETLQPESAMKSRKALTLGSLDVLFAFATATQAQDKKPTAKGINPAMVAAYEKAGATYGGMRTERRRIEEIAVLVDMWKDPYATSSESRREVQQVAAD